MLRLDLGCGPARAPGYLGVDVRPGPTVDLIADLSKGWPFKDRSVDEVRASHIFEHLPDPLNTMEELYRVLKPGGKADIDVPSTNGMGAFQDPTHKSFWNVNSFLYYDRKRALGGLYGCNLWDVLRCQEYNTPEMALFGPYVKAIVQKPQSGEEEAGMPHGN